MSRKFLLMRILLILMVIAISLMGTSVLAQSGTVVRVDPAAASAQVNDSVNLSIKVDNVTNLTAVELHLSFNPSVLEVTQMTNGGFIPADFVAQNVFDNTAGTIDYAVAKMNPPAAQGSGTLLNIIFRAKANGSSSIALRGTQAVPSGLLLSDANGQSIQASWANGTVTVGGVVSATNTSTPVTPATASPTPVTPATATPTSDILKTATPTLTSQPTVTLTPTSTTTPIPPPAGILGTHIVRWGESVYCIGRAYKVTPWAIAETNHLWWPNLIFPYQSLLIPNVPWLSIPAGPVCQTQFTTTSPSPTPIPTAIPTIITSIPPTATAATATPTPTATAGPPQACRYYYIVLPGDNLFRIALRFGTNYAELARINNIADPRLIYVGQQLCIP